MAKATIHLVDSSVMFQFYFNENPDTLAINHFVEGRYKAAGTFVLERTGEDAAEELFDLTNNPDRQDEREASYGRGRSLSVGDMVEVDGDMFLCASLGWVKITLN